MSDNTVTQKVALDCGHEAEFTFSGTQPDPALICPECGASDKLDDEQVSVIQKLFWLRTSGSQIVQG
jgi:hypothetical protein